jgi:hypothetical protein
MRLPGSGRIPTARWHDIYCCICYESTISLTLEALHTSLLDMVESLSWKHESVSTDAVDSTKGYAYPHLYGTNLQNLINDK